MTGSRLSRLRWPEDRHRIDLLMPSSKDIKGFETKSDAAREDAFRALSALKALELVPPSVDPIIAREFSRALDPSRSAEAPQTLASSRYVRHLRIRFVGALLAFLDRQEVEPLKAVTLVPLGWEFEATRLDQADPKKLLAQLRTSLTRLGAADGFLIAVLHGEFEPRRRIYRLHAHCLVGGGMAAVFNKLRRTSGYRARRISGVYRPVRFSQLKDRPRQLSYLLKSYWPSRYIGPTKSNAGHKRQRQGHRLKEPFHTQYMLWLDKHEFSEITLMIGCKATSDGIFLTKSCRADVHEKVCEIVK